MSEAGRVTIVDLEARLESLENDFDCGLLEQRIKEIKDDIYRLKNPHPRTVRYAGYYGDISLIEQDPELFTVYCEVIRDDALNNHHYDFLVEIVNNHRKNSCIYGDYYSYLYIEMSAQHCFPETFRKKLIETHIANKDTEGFEIKLIGPDHQNRRKYSLTIPEIFLSSPTYQSLLTQRHRNNPKIKIGDQFLCDVLGLMFNSRLKKPIKLLVQQGYRSEYDRPTSDLEPYEYYKHCLIAEQEQ